MELTILCLIVYLIEPYLWTACMKLLGYKYTKFRYTYQLTLWGYYAITVIKQVFIGSLHNDVLNALFSGGLVSYVIICTLLLYEGKTLKKLIWILAFLGSSLLAEVVVIEFSAIVLHQPMILFTNQTTVSFICTVVAKVLLVGICQLVYFRKDASLVKGLLENKEIVPLGLITILFELPASAIIKSINAERNSVSMLICAGIQFLLLLVTVYVFLVIKDKNQKFKYIQAQLENNKRSEKSQEILAKLQHDIAGHVHIMYSFCKQEQYDLLEKYISNVYKETQVPNAVYNTPDPALSILLGDMHRKAIKLKIRFEVHIVMDKFYMNSVDTCSFIGNMLNNAIEGTVKLPVEYRWVSLQLAYDMGGYMVECMNRAEKGATFGNTTKSNKKKHGYGLKIIDGIIRKYHGHIIEQNVMDHGDYTTVNIRIFFPVKEVQLMQERKRVELEKGNY